jgi:hypothetical protein
LPLPSDLVTREGLSNADKHGRPRGCTCLPGIEI